VKQECLSFERLSHDITDETGMGPSKILSRLPDANVLQRPGPRTVLDTDAQARIGLGVLLTAVAGYVDAVGYIALGGFFASFMSGASISLGIGMSEGHWNAVYQASLLIAAFLASATVATVVGELTGIWALPIVLLLEGGLLALTVVLSETGWSRFDSIFPVVAAMGVQNTTLRPVEGVRLGVTFMTGTLVSVGQGLGRALLRRGRPWSWAPHALLWCAFSAGAAVGASLYAAFGFRAVSGPAALVAATGVLFLIMVFFKMRSRARDRSASAR
jgi:uncharacterized membrane protein YoaK (UPF0700 family)